MMVVLIRKRIKTKVNVNTHGCSLIHVFQTSRKFPTISTVSQFKRINQILCDIDMKIGTKLGMDSHADTSCVNKHAFIEAIVDDMTVDAILFDETIGRLSNLSVVHAIYAFDNMNTAETMLLRINHAIYVENMKNALLCPNQGKCYGTIVDDIPPLGSLWPDYFLLTYGRGRSSTHLIWTNSISACM